MSHSEVREDGSVQERKGRAGGSKQCRAAEKRQTAERVESISEGDGDAHENEVKGASGKVHQL